MPSFKFERLRAAGGVVAVSSPSPVLVPTKFPSTKNPIDPFSPLLTSNSAPKSNLANAASIEPLGGEMISTSASGSRPPAMPVTSLLARASEASPLLSTATARSCQNPSGRFQIKLYGGFVTVPSRLVPAKKLTAEIDPSESNAFTLSLRWAGVANVVTVGTPGLIAGQTKEIAGATLVEAGNPSPAFPQTSGTKPGGATIKHISKIRVQ